MSEKIASEDSDVTIKDVSYSSATDKIQRKPLSLNQLRMVLHFAADGIKVPETAMVSRQKFSMFSRYCGLKFQKSNTPKKLPKSRL
jgi:hypothetical protein